MAKVGNDIGHGIDTFPPSKGVFKKGKGYAEHTFNAAVGLKIREHLQRHGVHSMEAQGANKPEVALNNRVRYYNAHNCDLVWSTHANYNDNKDVKGMGIFYWKGNEKAKRIAEYYIRLCREAGLPIWGNGVFESTNQPKSHWTNFAILRDTTSTSLLAENGFFSNDEDFERIFNTPSYIDMVAEISAKSILYGLGVQWKEGNKVATATQTKGTFRIKTGTFPNARSLADAIERVKKDFEFMFNEAADTTGFNPNYRIYTGTFSTKEAAEDVRKQIKEKYGWMTYLIDETK